MSNMLQVTTILGCKNSMLREGLRHILSNTRYKVHPEDLTRKSSRLLHVLGDPPFLFIIDKSLYGDDLRGTVQELKELHPDTRVVILADGFELEEMRASLEAGADGYCLATTGCEALIKYLDLVMLGEIVFPSAALLSAVLPVGEMRAARGETAAIRMPPVQVERSVDAKNLATRTLSSREAEILHCLMQGAPNKVIARKLEVAEATVKVHIKAILRKIRVANRTQAAMWAVNNLSSDDAEASWLHSGENSPPQGTTLVKGY